MTEDLDGLAETSRSRITPYLKRAIDATAIQLRKDEAVLEALKAAILARKEWEEPPALCFLEKVDGGFVVRDKSLFTEWPPGPTMALPHIADVMEQAPGFLVAAFHRPKNFIGLTFRCEAWMVAGKAGDAEELQKMQRKRQIHRHPDRIEQRCIVAATIDRRTYMVLQRRDTGEAESHASDKFDGIIPESLARMVAALLGDGEVTRPYEGEPDA